MWLRDFLSHVLYIMAVGVAAVAVAARQQRTNTLGGSIKTAASPPTFYFAL